jgi:serine phosphatase RsbU (regulator of sigma subunit)
MSAGGHPSELRRADAARNDERILEAAKRLLEHSSSATLSDIAAAARVSRSSVYRRFKDRDQLVAELDARPEDGSVRPARDPLPAGRLGRQRSLALDAIQVFDVVPPALLPEQLVAEAQRIAGVPVALYVLDIDGSHLLHMAGPQRLGEKLEAPFAIGPELDAQGIGSLRESLGERAGVELYALWLRGRATGVFVVFGRAREPLTEMARQAAAAVTLADRYTDVFARAQRRKQPRAAAEIQQSLLPPRIMRVTGAEVAGNVLPTYEVAGDWFDVVENGDGVWITVADGLGSSTRAAAASAVALGALRASRRSGAAIAESLLVMHQTLRELPGPRAEMSAIVALWEPGSGELALANCGHDAPVILRENGDAELMSLPPGPGLGGRSAPKPAEASNRLLVGDRLVLFSDGVVGPGRGQAGLGEKGVVEAALRQQGASAADTVRELHRTVRERAEGELSDDATAVCLSVG